MKEHNLEHLSKSSIMNYRNCPFKFYLQNMVKVKTTAPYVMQRGSAIHDTLYESIVKGKESLDFTPQINFVKGILKSLEPWNIVVAEKRMEATYQDMKLVGLMDLVIQASDKIIIFDYKSGNENPLHKYEFELGIYAFILSMNKIVPTHWGILFVDKNGVKVDEIMSDKISKSIGIAYQIWTEIKDRKFDRKLSSCKYCSYKNNCDMLWYQYNEEKSGQKKLI